MKKFYEEPSLEIEAFAIADVITASGTDENPDWSGDIGGGVQ